MYVEPNFVVRSHNHCCVEKQHVLGLFVCAYLGYPACKSYLFCAALYTAICELCGSTTLFQTA